MSESQISSLYVPPNSREYDCSIDNCYRKAYAKGFCNAHYIRHRKGIDLNLPIKNRKSGTLCRQCDKPLNGKGGWQLCSNHYRKERRRIIKSTLVEAMGGQCSSCNQEFPLSVYDFHHVGDKDLSPGRMIDNESLKTICEEIMKCILLCANCHRIEHHE